MTLLLWPPKKFPEFSFFFFLLQPDPRETVALMEEPVTKLTLDLCREGRKIAVIYFFFLF